MLYDYYAIAGRHFLQVREVKTAREKEQDIAKETIEALKIKQQREKAQEMSVSENS